MTHNAESDAGLFALQRCCICGRVATRIIQTRGLFMTGQTLYCDSHAAELLARATHTRPTSPADMCHNGHEFVAGISEDDPDNPSPAWCHVCGEDRVTPPDHLRRTQLRV